MKQIFFGCIVSSLVCGWKISKFNIFHSYLPISTPMLILNLFTSCIAEFLRLILIELLIKSLFLYLNESHPVLPHSNEPIILTWAIWNIFSIEKNKWILHWEQQKLNLYLYFFHNCLLGCHITHSTPVLILNLFTSCIAEFFRLILIELLIKSLFLYLNESHPVLPHSNEPIILTWAIGNIFSIEKNKWILHWEQQNWTCIFTFS